MTARACIYARAITETAKKTKIRRRVMSFLIFLSFRLAGLFHTLFAYSLSPGSQRFVTPISDFFEEFL